MAMIGYMYYNRFGNKGFTDGGRGRTTADVQTCPVCLLRFNASGGTLPDDSVLTNEAWGKEVGT
jgi:hypothetical protein